MTSEITEQEMLKIKELIEDIQFGSVTVVVQDGKIVQLERQEKVRMY